MLVNVAVNMALHSATMSAINASRGSHGGGSMTTLEFCWKVLVCLYITYIVAGVLIGLIIKMYDNKRDFILDLLIPFRGVYRVIKYQFNQLD